MNKVYIVGAGCGDINLYTLKAVRLLKEADCIVYDDLIDQPILDYCKPGVKKLYVGKRKHKHSLTQDAINQLLIDASNKYSITVRLKGGDPYVFGRGGEEVIALRNANKHFEVVPGISSCVGGLAYAGIPVTHRGVSRGFQVYTAHFENDGKTTMPFSNMLDHQYTYIFLMAISRLDKIVSGLLEAGKEKTTPIAIVSNASLPNQQVLTSTLESVLEDYKNSPLPTPGIIVVGEVVNLQETLDFTQFKPLSNKKVLVSLVEKDPSLISSLEFYGASVLQVSSGHIKYQEFEMPKLEGYFIFTSSHGVKGFMEVYLKEHDLRELSRVKFIVVGQKTKEALKEYGIIADYMPSSFNGETLNKEFERLVKGSQVTLFRGNHPSSVTIANSEVVVYQNIENKIQLQNTQYDYGLFTSPSSFERFYKVNGDVCTKYISIGNHTTKKMKESISEKRILTSIVSTKDEMLRTLLEDVTCQ